MRFDVGRELLNFKAKSVKNYNLNFLKIGIIKNAWNEEFNREFWFENVSLGSIKTVLISAKLPNFFRKLRLSFGLDFF